MYTIGKDGIIEISIKKGYNTPKNYDLTAKGNKLARKKTIKKKAKSQLMSIKKYTPKVKESVKSDSPMHLSEIFRKRLGGIRNPKTGRSY
jgi:hypothetical protein|tara:strand:+ start:2300 stop:2569 length:270 start_codon:yes stop_codon:yes gene_type:complete